MLPTLTEINKLYTNVWILRKIGAGWRGLYGVVREPRQGKQCQQSLLTLGAV